MTSAPAPVFGIPSYAREICAAEGFCPHLYLDTRGNVTLGFGELVASANQALAYEWRDRRTGRILGRSEDDVRRIRRAFEDVKAAPFGNYVAGFYREFSDIAISRAHGAAIRDGRIAQFLRELAILFPDFETYPEPAKRALLDMVFNLGATRLRRLFPMLGEAVKARRWPEAAAESRRKAVSAERNERVRDWFLEAAFEDQAGPGLAST